MTKIESVPPNPATDRPTKQIRITDVSIYKDPYEEFKTKLAKRLARDQENRDEEGAKAKARAEREKDRTTWFGTQLGEKGVVNAKRSLDDQGIGKYLNGAGSQSQASKAKLVDDGLSPEVPPPKKAKRPGGGFGSFEGW